MVKGGHHAQQGHVVIGVITPILALALLASHN
jgi:hypothetical protein